VGLIDEYLEYGIEMMKRKSQDNTMNTGLEDKTKADRY
jgi:hypothetical protein